MQFVERGEIPKWWIPDKVIISEKELPKTSTAKPIRRYLGRFIRTCYLNELYKVFSE